MFGTSGVRGPVGDVVTGELALEVGRAVAGDADRVVLGRDARDSGRALCDALAAGAMECGADVIDVGTAATPTIARAVAWRDADAGIVVTASHNPPQDNGIKLWTPSGQAFDAAQRETIASRIEADEFAFAAWDGHGTRREWDDAVDAHLDELVRAGRERAPDGGLEGLSVVVDVGNGMGAVTADALYELGASVETLNAQPDGRFPARPSEPTAENCRSLAAHVAATDADLGLAHDGDADRTMAVDDTGSFVSGDQLLALFGRTVAGEGDAVAAPVDTSLAVADALADVGASLVRTRVGDVFVAERTRDSGVVFGGEPSGAWIFPAETLCPDGPLAAVVLATLAIEDSLSSRLAEIPEYPIRRDAIETDRKREVMERVAEVVREEHERVDTIDGVRVTTGDGWFLLRASGTQPLIRVTAEARDPSVAADLLEEARGVIAGAIE